LPVHHELSNFRLGNLETDGDDDLLREQPTTTGANDFSTLLVHRSSIVAVLNLFVLAFSSAASARGQ
jgi:hypothetical protein